MNRMNPHSSPTARTTTLVAALVAGLALVACTPDTRDLPVNGDGAAAVGELVDLQVLNFLIGNDLPGATLAVTRAGKLVWSKGYGYAHLADQTPMQPWHRSRTGSVSKLLTTIGALQLVEQDKLDLDLPLYGDPGPFQSRNVPWPPPDRSDWAWPFTPVLDDPETYWEAMRDGVYDLHHDNDVHREMNQTRAWASQATVRHLLSHTSGLLRSGHGDQVEEYYGGFVHDYPDAHKAILLGVIEEREDAEAALTCFLGGSLYVPRTVDGDPDGDPNPAYTGQRHRLPPYGFAPGTERCYSNHAFGLMGHIVGAASGGRTFYAVQGYQDHIRAGVLDPLGLDDVVPNNTGLAQGRDAWPHGDALDPDKPAWFTSTGSWSSSAQDMARIMCGLDRGSNHLRLLRPDMVATMETVHFPQADPNQPLGWDRREHAGTELWKSGGTGGGTALVAKFLPGRFSHAPKDEINVALMVNSDTERDASAAMWPLLRAVGDQIARADIPDTFDLFDPAYRCVVDGPTLTILSPVDGASFPLGTEIFVEAEAYDGAGNALPISWTVPHGGDRVSQPSPSDGRHSLFLSHLPAGTHTLVATAEDAGGYEAMGHLTLEVTYDPPEVSIISHASGDTVWAGAPLHLAGQTTTGGHFFALPDDQLRWEVWRGGVRVREGTGPTLTVPADVMLPGSYTVRFTGDDGIASAVDVINLVAEAPPAGLPTIFLRRPLADSVHTPSLSVVSVSFLGAARDHQGNIINGTYFRWTAVGGGSSTVLCEGSGIGGHGSSGGGGFVAPKSCADFTATLTGYHPVGTTPFTIILEVKDPSGVIDERRVTINVVVPPAG
jgi:ELWxxDGT repeat protein